MIKCGIIGFGKMGRIRNDAIVASGKGSVLKAYDPYCRELNGIIPASSPDEIINDSSIEAIFIATPNLQNKDFTIRALRAGKHVFCEKPPAFTGKDVEEIIKEEHSSKKRLMYGFNHRHHESVMRMERMVNSGEYGKILWMRGRYGKSVDHNYLNTWRANKELAGGGILLDQGIHMLDLFLLLAGEFDETQAMVSNLYWKLEGIEDNVFANLRNTKTGVVASLHSTMTQWRHLFSLEVFLEKGYFVLNGLKTQSGSYGDEVLTVAKNRSTAPAASWEDEEKFVFHNDNSWLNETTIFLDAVEKEIPISNGSSDDALKVMKLIDICYSKEMHSRTGLHSKLI